MLYDNKYNVLILNKEYEMNKTYVYSSTNGNKNGIISKGANKSEYIPQEDRSGVVLFFGLLLVAGVIGLIIVLM